MKQTLNPTVKGILYSKKPHPTKDKAMQWIGNIYMQYHPFHKGSHLG